MGPGFRRYRMHTSLPASSAVAYTLRPATAGRGRGPTRQRWEGEGRPVPWCRAVRENGGSLWRGAAKNEVTGTPLTLPLLRNGPLPLPASRARGVWAVLGRDVAGQRCVNPIAAKAGTHSSA